MEVFDLLFLTCFYIKTFTSFILPEINFLLQIIKIIPMKTRIITLILFSAFLFIQSCTEDEEVVLPVATATPMAQNINSGTATSITLTSTVAATTFAWTVVQNGVSGATSGSGSSIVQTLTATGANSGTATYTITPTANGTSGSPVTVVVTVAPVSVKVTYTANIKPLLTTSCAPCHLAGGGNPNKWDNYATTKSKISGIINRVSRESNAAGFMPQGGSKLSAENIALLNQWVTDGLLEN
jgi:hypothetical protein